MSDGLLVAIVTLILIALRAVFVVIEFALLGARRHRLEATAATNRSARAALRGVNELTLMLAFAQLGITACTFALGAVTKPALDAWLGPVFSTWGLPLWASGALAFALSLFIVTFLHLVVGEMAPKSWAIARPETAAQVIGTPSRIFIWPFRPLLVWINSIANKLVRATGVVPVESAAVGGQNAETVRHLVELSARKGTLDRSFQHQFEGAIELETLRLDELVDVNALPTVVPHDASIAAVQRLSAQSGHMRILVGDSDTGIVGVIHLRDTVLDPSDAPAAPFVRPVLTLAGETPVYEALAQMRAASQQLVVVTYGAQSQGVVTLSDILPRLLPRTGGAMPTRIG